MRKLYDSQQKREVLKMKDLKLHIKTVMREFSKATKLDVFEFFIYQKCFAMIHNLIFKKSLTICNAIGKYLADRCYAEFTVKYIRELQLLDTSEPNVIPTLIHVTLVTMKGFSNYNSFAKSLAQQEIVPLLNKYITICSNETLDEEQTTNVKQAIGILLNISIKASKKIHNIKTDPAFIFLQLVKWNLKNRSSFVFNLVETGPFLATKGIVYKCIF
ncbi:uncharacterized protein LOC131948827 [Physella acuta]|uniref:uncharacterized protein LOC131948827 n=1 Tax=Physella acuta TaxID=109671 RepID=UPI0027DAE8F6|nr:uncharacterized protein LOC131948827 [Physella acuta]